MTLPPSEVGKLVTAPKVRQGDHLIKVFDLMGVL